MWGDGKIAIKIVGHKVSSQTMLNMKSKKIYVALKTLGCCSTLNYYLKTGKPVKGNRNLNGDLGYGSIAKTVCNFWVVPQCVMQRFEDGTIKDEQ